MAGAYGSHGETYLNPGHLLWWSVGGDLIGEAPARLAFLKKIMIENGIEAEMRKQQEFFKLAERFRNATDPEEARRGCR